MGFIEYVVVTVATPLVSVATLLRGKLSPRSSPA
jgi:hypothetical protein